jgi:hypothetical protein
MTADAPVQTATAPAAVVGDTTREPSAVPPTSAAPVVSLEAPAEQEAAPDVKPLTKEEQKRLEKAAAEERKAEERRRKDDERAAKQAQKDAEKAMKEAEKAAKRAKQQG